MKNDFKILSVEQIRQADAFTIANEPITSLDLMERAANQCFEWIKKNYSTDVSFHLFCGTGNNGGDGLAIARLLNQNGYDCTCYEVILSNRFSEDYLSNKKRLKGIPIKTLKTPLDFQFPSTPTKRKNVIIDALLGSGLNRPVSGNVKTLIQKINRSSFEIISIDIPSGMFAEFNTENPRENIVQATQTLSFQTPKLAFLLPESGGSVGKFHILDIGLHQHFFNKAETTYFYNSKRSLTPLIKRKEKFSHKGTFGHLLLISGSKGKMGAAVLAAKSALMSGVGKLSVLCPTCGLEILQTTIPEAMVEMNKGTDALEGTYEGNRQCIAVGPGIGINNKTQEFLLSVIKATKSPLVIDADAINILSRHPQYLKLLPPYSILTPHPKEFERLVGAWKSDAEKLTLLQDFTSKYKCICVLKGAHSAIAFPDKKIWFNSTGNPGMATAGSGDVLTGIIGSFLAQNYEPKVATRLGVYLHGKAGDFASQKYGRPSMLAGNIQEFISSAFNNLLS